MIPHTMTYLPLLLYIVLTSVQPALAQSADYQPLPGQAGKDVVWIPTPGHVATEMLDLAKITASDYVIDLGSGDGRLVIEAAKRGARAHGVEFNPDLVELSRRNALAAGVAERATFTHGDMFEADISKATALPLFLIPTNLEKLAPKFLKLAPGARIVSNTYEIGGGWQPDETLHARPCLSWCVAHLYIVPANAAGAWQLEDGSQFLFEQHYQQVYGSYQIGDIAVAIDDGLLKGHELRFTINNTVYNAHIQGDRMSGTAQGREPRSFSARRVSN
jgi:SAM-dependent methyltransferase